MLSWGSKAGNQPGWLKLAAFRRMQKWPQNFRQAHVLSLRQICRLFARNCKFANLIQCNMQYTPCNKALLAQETLLLSNKSTFLPQDFQKA